MEDAGTVGCTLFAVEEFNILGTMKESASNAINFLIMIIEKIANTIPLSLPKTFPIDLPLLTRT